VADAPDEKDNCHPTGVGAYRVDVAQGNAQNAGCALEGGKPPRYPTKAVP